MSKPMTIQTPVPADPSPTGGAWERLPDGTLRPVQTPQNHADEGTLSALQQAAEAASKPAGEEV